MVVSYTVQLNRVKMNEWYTLNKEMAWYTKYINKVNS